MTKKDRVLSGMRPTGPLHLGHLVGALENWRRLQDQYECFFMVADYHAFMSEYEHPEKLMENILENVAGWIACGIDPEKSVFFRQSYIPYHVELYMILSALTPLGWVERVPTYKEQLREVAGRDLTTYGFLGYPVLQAADILLYRANIVPVGEDQVAHLELTREIVRRFKSLYGEAPFPEPKELLTGASRLLGIDRRKMSKSYNNTINFSDSREVVWKKTQSMITDPLRIKMSDPGHPDQCNVYSYYKTFDPLYAPTVYDYCTNAKKGCTECKAHLGERLDETLEPIRKKREELLKNRKELLRVLEAGTARAESVALETFHEVRRLVGLQ